MAVDIKLMKERLKSYNRTYQKKSSLIWRPTKSESTIRIVPNQYNRQDPFIVGYFYYNMNGKTICSPMSIGEPDPIVEQAEKLMSTGNKDDWKYGRSMMPKKRTFVPIIDRDAEEEGIKFWGFGQTIESDLLTYITNQDYGDITDFETGVDLIIGHKTPAEAGNSFGETTVLPKRRSTALTTDKNKLDEWLNEQPEFFKEVYTPLTYDEIQKEFDKYLSGEKDEDIEEVNQEDIEEIQLNSTAKDESEVDDIIARIRSRVKK